MTGGTLASAVRGALSRQDWQQSISGVKTAIADAISHLDRRITIRDTGYFNHSFVPDFTLEWPNRLPRRRDVYLRLDASAGFISNDLRHLGPTHPILIGLLADHIPVLPDTTGEAAEQSDSLVTEPDALENLAAEPETRLARVLSPAMVRGGRGVVGGAEADGLTTNIDSFFAAVTVHDAGTVAGSSAPLTRHLSETESSALLSFGRVMWEATGGSPSEYPLQADLSVLDDIELRFLMEEGPPASLDFWRSVGRSSTIQQLVALGPSEPANLRDFLVANLDRLLARFMMAKADQPQLADSALPRWVIAQGALALRGHNFVAHIAERHDDLAEEPNRGPGIGIPELRVRAVAADVDAVTVTTDEGKTVSIESPRAFNVASDKILGTLTSTPDTLVTGMGIMVGGRHLECRFTDATASGRTNAQFSVAELLRHALPVLWRLSDQDDAQIKEMIRLNAEVSEPPTLFSA